MVNPQAASKGAMASMKPVDLDAPVGMPCRSDVAKGPTACSTASTTPSTAPAMAHAISTCLRSMPMAAFPFPFPWFPVCP